MTQLVEHIQGLGEGGPSSPWCRRTERSEVEVRRREAVQFSDLGDSTVPKGVSIAPANEHSKFWPAATPYIWLGGKSQSPSTNHNSLITAFLIDTLPIRIVTNLFDCRIGARSNRHSSATPRLTSSKVSSAVLCHFRVPANASAIEVECAGKLEQTSRGARDVGGQVGGERCAAARSFENYWSEI